MNGSVLQMMKSLGVGVRSPHDEFFRHGNDINKVHKVFGVHEVDDEEFYHKSYSAFPCHIPNCAFSCETVYDYDQHYNSCHRFSCSQCNKHLPSSHLLDLHLMETHDAYFAALSERKPMFQCYLQECKNVFKTPEERREHCIKEHKFPGHFRFDDKKKKTKKGGDEAGKKNKKTGSKGKEREKAGGGTKDTEMTDASVVDEQSTAMEVSSEGNVFKLKTQQKSTRKHFRGGRKSQLDLDCFVKDMKDSLSS